MPIYLDPSLPIANQISDGLKRQIVGGQLAPGQKITPVRDMAAELGVNPNTLQKALMQLEYEGLLYTARTAGRYVTTDEYIIAQSRMDMMGIYTGRFLYEMRDMGCTPDEILDIVQKNLYSGQYSEG